ncbi:NADP-dependent succinic semialdehyde dehydrogenase [Embleya scabrispora]|uniref:NADP-dependent succinic semialdehyde dehydrogenase n=1 Tax=Embleya scabrispora TaxID=159449 RepID=UPI00038021A7|nr:NADP-dependent succinic semialdehyde dehydrogenase [Embleya scabrispora]MYS82293.1 NADP-dependent succinic semialdehyde dehydrogenase [Streptomyces sp. SID5474]
MAIASVNPATGETIEEFAEIGEPEIEARIARSDEVFRAHRRDAYDVRAKAMRRAADLLDAEKGEVAAMMTAEMGKTLAAAEAEVAKCARLCRFYADRAADFLADERADADAVGARKAYVRYEPLGPVLAVMPWNFPLWQAMRFAAPALMAGNTGLLKHASNVPRTALYLGELFTRAGFPEGAFQTLLIGSKLVERVLSDPRVVAATLTGSEGAGRSIAAIAGRELKKTVLELGGSDPFLVLPSADIEAAARTATTARTQNNGQSCIAAKRFIVHTDVYDDFAAAFTANMAALRVGDPTAAGTDVGPLAQEQGVRDVTEQVEDARAKGARILCGGERPPGPGWYYPPTVVAELTPDMRMYREEVFGPVAGLYRVSDLDEAIALANATPFGLGANAWTDDDAEQRRCAAELAAGAVFVNGMVTSHPELPFGGIKTSGYGRELAHLGIREFCNAKTVWVGGG